MDKEKAYRDLIAHTNHWLFGMPGSDLLMALLEMRFTPEECENKGRTSHFNFHGK